MESPPESNSEIKPESNINQIFKSPQLEPEQTEKTWWTPEPMNYKKREQQQVEPNSAISTKSMQSTQLAINQHHSQCRRNGGHEQLDLVS